MKQKNKQKEDKRLPIRFETAESISEIVNLILLSSFCMEF